MKRMFKPCRDPPDFCRWRSLSCRASDPEATAATSGATSMPADERLNSRLEKARRSGSWFIARSFPDDLSNADEQRWVVPNAPLRSRGRWRDNLPQKAKGGPCRLRYFVRGDDSDQLA